MKKRRIVLASLLKPVNDTRMLEKMGRSLARSGEYEVHVIGYPSEATFIEPAVHIHPLSKFKRISFGRIAARLKAVKIVIKVKPELLIINTHELLIVAVLFRIFFGTKIFYDIQENYWQNIRHTNAFPAGTRTIIAGLVRIKEVLTSPYVSHFILAEKCYSDELRFVNKKFTVLENKCIVPKGFQRKPAQDFIQLIFTGTLAKSTGVFQAIELTKKIHQQEPRIKLSLIGYCALPAELEKIKKEIERHSFIGLVGGSELVPHTTITEAISKANFGIIYYPLSPHIENKTPTKLFEYLSCHLPILLQNHPPWLDLCAPFNAAIPVDFIEPDVDQIVKKIHFTSFFSSQPEGTTWESEEAKLQHLVHSIF